MSEILQADICVIGAGAGGLSVAAGAAQMGAKVVLLEGGKMGGDCLNHGCVPSKSLLAVAHAAHTLRSPGLPGIKPAGPAIDFAAAKTHLKEVIASIEPHDSQERFESLGVHVIRAFGKFVSPTEVQAGDHRIRARRFVVATGSTPFVPPIPGLEDVPFETNETIFDLEAAPDHLVIIGAGPIGLEMAQAHRRLGSKVTVIEAGRALVRDDPDLVSVVLNQLRHEGIEILEYSTAVGASGTSGNLEVTLENGERVSGSHLLVAVGRKANVRGLGLDAAGVEFDRLITVDQGMRTTNRRIFAIGDVASPYQFTHIAGYHAGLVVRSALFGMRARSREDHFPWVTFTSPELAQVGLSEADAKEKYGDKVTVVRKDFADIDRARAIGQTTGFLKLVVHKGRPVGVSIVGDNAGELIAFWSLAISARLKVSAIAGMIMPYPTLSDINKQAAGAYFTPHLFESPLVKRVVKFVNKVLP